MAANEPRAPSDQYRHLVTPFDESHCKIAEFWSGAHATAFDCLTDLFLAGFRRCPRAPARPAEWSAIGCEYGQSFWYTRRSGLGPVARRRDLTSDGIQADQLKRAFIRLSFTSVHFNENLPAIRHRAQEANDVALKGEASPRLRVFPALFDGRLIVDPIYDLHRTIRGLFPGAHRRRNYQLRAVGATVNGERGRGVLRRRACRCLRSDLRPIVHRRGRLADKPVRALRLHGVRCPIL